MTFSFPCSPLFPLRISSSIKRGLTLVELLVVFVVLVVLAALMLPFTRNARGAAQRMQCQNNLKQLGLAMHNYHSIEKLLPPAYTMDVHGNRLHSWRTLLLPYLENGDLYRRIDLSRSWNDRGQDAAFSAKMPLVYRCQASKFPDRTLYQVVVDPEGCFPNAQSVSLDDIVDGLSNTALAIEVPEGRGVEWRSPVDTDWRTWSEIGKKTPQVHHDIVHCLLADGAVRQFASDTDSGIRRAYLTISAGDSVEQVYKDP